MSLHGRGEIVAPRAASSPMKLLCWFRESALESLLMIDGGAAAARRGLYLLE